MDRHEAEQFWQEYARMRVKAGLVNDLTSCLGCLAYLLLALVGLIVAAYLRAYGWV